ncbi:hypothetical protein BC937DRAFT_95443 [Endogone sp. FLAS-F59071]|nr:hypothetical protein BC937DRAFT_95443 [Endogone sp. FLAS-F59071]|eukprot:RUS13350.1 hypothetical protein BC937DRAFT_95443 [Endogone sp. FLAS-F59071]
MLNTLQDDAKTYADKRDYVVVFVSSEGNVRSMMTGSSWLRAEEPTVIGDVTKEEALEYLKKLSIKKEDAESFYELAGGRMVNLKKYGDHIKHGGGFADVRQTALNNVEESFERTWQEVVTATLISKRK